MKYWIARDKNGNIEIFKEKPYVIRGCEWDSEGEEYLRISYEDSFPEVTFENSPQEVEIKLINQ